MNNYFLVDFMENIIICDWTFGLQKTFKKHESLHLSCSEEFQGISFFYNYV